MKLNKKALWTALAALMIVISLPVAAFADEPSNDASANNKFYFNKKSNTGRDNGYSGLNQIKDDDPHFGWNLGQFIISGFTSKTGDDDMPIFLKNVGDKVKLSFILEQSIDALNDDETKSISDDKNGHDQYFEIPKSENGFGHGTLIVRHTNHQNESTNPQVYNDYLKALEVGTETEIQLFEEGDYEVALDYEVKSPGFIPFTSSYNNYRIYFEFQVRNSNSMVFLFDTDTNKELFNRSTTTKGFRVDLAGSNYLDVSVKKEVMNSTGDGLTEDTRFNKSATNGQIFNEEGIYTITAKSPSTGGVPTEKRIYVGTDPALKAAVANQMTVEDAQRRLKNGDTIDESGLFTTVSTDLSSATSTNANEQASEQGQKGFSLAATIALMIAVTIGGALIIKRQRRVSRTDVRSELNKNESSDDTPGTRDIPADIDFSMGDNF